MNKFRTIQEIEAMELSKFDRKLIAEIRRDLLKEFYLTSHRELLIDGRKAKVVLGEQDQRFLDYLMS